VGNGRCPALAATALLTVALVILVLSAQGCDRGAEQANNREQAKTDLLQPVSKAVSPKVTFVELGSVGCIPCKRMQPIMREIEKEYEGQVKVIFYDVRTNAGRPYAQQYRIRVIPTQVFLDKNGKEYFRHEGFFPKDELVEVLKRQGVM
jgi:thioredoxin 1